MTGTDFLVGLVIGVVLAAAAFAGIWGYFRARVRRRRDSKPDADPAAQDAGIATSPAGGVASPNAGPSGSPARTWIDVPGVSTTDPVPVGVSASLGGDSIVYPANGGDPVRLSRRVLVHLARQGHPTSGSTVVELRTQRGIGAALGATQGALSGVLRRLEDGGAIASEKTHVHGRDRRVKIYVLTPRGEQLATDAKIPPGP